MTRKPKHPPIGSIVQIITPSQFIRCGYPLTHRVLQETHPQDIFPIADKLYAQLYNHPIPEPSLVDGGILNINASNLYDKDQRVYSHLVSAVCSKLIAGLGWGGKERQIFESPIEPYRLRAPLGWRVEFKRFVKTGTRFPPRSYRSYEGEYDWEPGGLDNEQTHCILTLYNLSCNDTLPIRAAYCSLIPSQTR